MQSNEFAFDPYYEVIVSDDGSPAADFEHLEDIFYKEYDFYFDRTLVHRKTNGGWTAAVRAAVAKASGQYILLLDDDVLYPIGLLGVVRSLLAVDGVGVLSWRSLGDRPGQSREAHPGFIQPATSLAGYCMAFRRSLWDQLGGFDTRFRTYCGDSDFALRAMLSGHPSYRVWWPLIPHAEHRSFEESPELGDRNAVAARDLEAFAKKWGCSSSEMEARALAGLVG